VTRRAERPDKHESIAFLWAQAAHDLRQPVQAALLLANMLDGVSTPTELRRAARGIESALGSLYEMLEVLTLLARVDAGLQIVPLRTCQFPDVLQPAIEEFIQIAKKWDIPLRLRDLSGTVRSNPKLLTMVVRSLFLNVVRFGNGSGILIGCRRSCKQFRLEFRFGGALPYNASKNHAFVQLTSRSDRLTAGELGLGLALVEHLCRVLGHELRHSVLGPDRQSLVMTLPMSVGSR
jgi:signal transduction histidine kinase